MDAVGDAKDVNADRCTDASCDDVKDSSTDSCHKEQSDDAELDDILDGTLKILTIINIHHVCCPVWTLYHARCYFQGYS